MSSSPGPSRIDRARFDSARFPCTFDLPIRHEDLDGLWHVNNAAAVGMLQEGRVVFNREMDLPRLGLGGLRTVIVGMNVEFSREMTYPGVAEISTGIFGVGRTSLVFGQLIRQEGQSAVYAQITMVATDETGAIPIPDDMRTAFEERCLIG